MYFTSHLIKNNILSTRMYIITKIKSGQVLERLYMGTRKKSEMCLYSSILYKTHNKSLTACAGNHNNNESREWCRVYITPRQPTMRFVNKGRFRGPFYVFSVPVLLNLWLRKALECGHCGNARHEATEKGRDIEKLKVKGNRVIQHFL